MTDPNSQAGRPPPPHQTRTKVPNKYKWFLFVSFKSLVRIPAKPTAAHPTPLLCRASVKVGKRFYQLPNS
jgi:hypothetical protein